MSKNKNKKDPYRHQRREIAPPTQIHKDKSKYTRKQKHKGKNWIDE